ncbi:MAG: NACHT domain-containing protein, partial [Chloroflexi bacterium]|nr:NACHT domain-containing protein [Chloroflexota bacterium]
MVDTSEMRGPFRDPLPHQDWGEAPDTAGFVGRAKELQALQSWVRDERCRMVAVLGMGGVGKTSLATRLVREVAPIFERIYWRSLRDAPPPSDWLAGAIAFLSDQQREPPAAESERLATLMQLLRERRCLLVLDNFDTLFEPGQSEGRYREGLDGYGRLLLAVGESTHQSCLVLTSREAPQERAVLISDMTRTLRLGGLSVDEAQKLLAPKAVAGSRSDWVELTNRCSGNGLALKIVGETIRDRFVGQIASFLAQAPGGSALTGLRELLTDQIERSPAAEQEMLEVLALHREPQTLTELRAALGVDSSRAAPIDTIEALRRRSLVERVRIGGTTGFTLQSVVLEYLTDRLVESVADEIRRKQPSLLVRVPLIKAQAKDYVRCAQEVLIGEAILGQLADSRDTNERLLALLQSWRNQPATDQGYGPGNVINLLRLLRGDLRGLDLSRLEIRQAYLAEVEAQAASLAGAHLEHVVLPDAFAMPLTLVLSADGAFLAAGTSDGEVWLWRVADRQLLLAIQEHRSAVQGLALSADGVVMATGDHSGTVRLWDTSFAVDDRTRSRLVRTAPSEHSADPSAAGGRLLATLTGHSMAVLCTAFAPDGRLLASGGTGGTVRLWDAISGRPVARLQGHTGAVFSLAFSADGRVLASGGADQTIRLWDVSTGEALLTLQEQVGVVRSLAFSADGTVMASGTEDGSVRVWQASTRDVLARFRAHSGGVWSVALAADGHLLASGGGDGMARLWDPRTGQLLTTLHAHTAGVIGAGLSADGNLVATGSEDGTIRLWDAHTGRGLATLQGQPGGVRSLALSADGHVVATA